MITRQKIVSITLLPLLSLVALVAVACPTDGEATSPDAMNEPAPVTTVGDPEPVQTPEIPVTVIETPATDTDDDEASKAADPAPPPADTETEEEVMGMTEEGAEIIELTIVMVSEDDTTPPATSDEQDNSPDPSQTPDPDDSDEQDNSPEPRQTPEQEEQPPAQDEDVMEMSEETRETIELTIVMVSEDDTTPPATSDEQDNSPDPSQTPDPDDSDEQDDSSEPDVTPAPRQTPPPPTPEPAEPMYKTAPDFTLPSIKGGEISLSEYSGRPVVLVFYRSYFCTYCRSQLSALNNDYDEFQNRNTEILAISSDNIDSLTSQLIRRSPDGLRFPTLYTSLDPTVPKAYDRYGKVPDGGYLGGAELADPGVFLINAEGQIVWKDLGTSIRHSVSAQTILDQIDNLPGS